MYIIKNITGPGFVYREKVLPTSISTLALKILFPLSAVASSSSSSSSSASSTSGTCKSYFKGLFTKISNLHSRVCIV